MKRTLTSTIAFAAAAAFAALALAGCTIGPLELPDIELPIGVSTSVAEARAARRAAASPAVADSDLNEAGTLTVGIVSTTSAPFAITGTDGTYTGIDVDTAYALADQLGLSSVKFQSVTDASSGLLTGCDVVMGVTAGTGTGDYTVVGNYAQGAIGIFSKAEVTAPIDASTLTGATVAVQTGSATQVEFARIALAVSEQGYANLNECFEALDAGEVDYVVCDAYSGAYLAAAYDEAYFAGTFGDATTVGIAVLATSTNVQSAVQSALDAIQVNGVANLAKARWVGTLPVLGETTKVMGLTSTATVTSETVPVVDETQTDGTATDAATDGTATDATADGTSTDATADGENADAGTTEG